LKLKETQQLLGNCDDVNLLYINTNTLKTENGRFCINEFRPQVVVQRTEDTLIMSRQHKATEYFTINVNTLSM
jgi:hypothetical protein